MVFSNDTRYHSVVYIRPRDHRYTHHIVTFLVKYSPRPSFVCSLSHSFFLMLLIRPIHRWLNHRHCTPPERELEMEKNEAISNCVLLLLLFVCRFHPQHTVIFWHILHHFHHRLNFLFTSTTTMLGYSFYLSRLLCVCQEFCMC